MNDMIQSEEIILLLLAVNTNQIKIIQLLLTNYFT